MAVARNSRPQLLRSAHFPGQRFKYMGTHVYGSKSCNRSAICLLCPSTPTPSRLANLWTPARFPPLCFAFSSPFSWRSLLQSTLLCYRLRLAVKIDTRAVRKESPHADCSLLQLKSVPAPALVAIQPSWGRTPSDTTVASRAESFTLEYGTRGYCSLCPVKGCCRLLSASRRSVAEL